MTKWTVMYWVEAKGKRVLVVDHTPDNYEDAKRLANEKDNALIIEDYKGE